MISSERSPVKWHQKGIKNKEISCDVNVNSNIWMQDKLDCKLVQTTTLKKVRLVKLTWKTNFLSSAFVNCWQTT